MNGGIQETKNTSCFALEIFFELLECFSVLKICSTTHTTHEAQTCYWNETLIPRHLFHPVPYWPLRPLHYCQGGYHLCPIGWKNHPKLQHTSLWSHSFLRTQSGLLDRDVNRQPIPKHSPHLKRKEIVYSKAKHDMVRPLYHVPIC